MEKNKNDKRKTFPYLPFIITSFIVLLFWIGSMLILRKIFTVDVAGTFGDSFGAINALFSGLAFAGIIATIIMQKRELELQRIELTETRKELHRSAEAQDALQKAQNIQVNLMAVQVLLQSYQNQKEALEKLTWDQKNEIDSTSKAAIESKIFELAQNISALRSEIEKVRATQPAFID